MPFLIEEYSRFVLVGGFPFPFIRLQRSCSLLPLLLLWKRVVPLLGSIPSGTTNAVIAPSSRFTLFRGSTVCLLFICSDLAFDVLSILCLRRGTAPLTFVSLWSSGVSLYGVADLLSFPFSSATFLIDFARRLSSVEFFLVDGGFSGRSCFSPERALFNLVLAGSFLARSCGEVFSVCRVPNSEVRSFFFVFSTPPLFRLLFSGTRTFRISCFFVCPTGSGSYALHVRAKGSWLK